MVEQSSRLLITAGAGPAECCLGVEKAAYFLRDELETRGHPCDLVWGAAGKAGLIGSVLLIVPRSAMAALEPACGTWLWACPSPLRKGHARKNWFFAVQAMPQAKASVSALPLERLIFSALRAGGPGGQHQNTTESAVRAYDPVTKLAVVARDGRSQHANKKKAIQRLQAAYAAHLDLQAASRKAEEWQALYQVVRGSPVRSFKGPEFKAV